MNKLFEIINTEAEYNIVLKRTIEIFYAEEGSSESNELDTLLLLIKDYEDRHYNIPTANIK